jgi:hypothetical protein
MSVSSGFCGSSEAGLRPCPVLRSGIEGHGVEVKDAHDVAA